MWNLVGQLIMGLPWPDCISVVLRRILLWSVALVELCCQWGNISAIDSACKDLNKRYTTTRVSTQQIFYPGSILIELLHHLTLHWRHNGRDSVSNHQPHDCLLNRLFRRRSKKNETSASLAFVWGIHRGPVNSPHKWPVTRKMFPFDDVIMFIRGK